MKPNKILCALLITLLLCAVSGCEASIAPETEPIPFPALKTQGNYVVDDETGQIIAGSWPIALRSEAGGTVSWNDPYPGISGQDYSDPEYYTYREYIASTGGLKWSPLTWETSADAYILGYTATGFYRFVPNSTLSGWTVVDEMARGAPRDVTADYVGQYGIEAGQTARAWQITLNPQACWDNGVPINADTYLYSYQQLLDGKMMNRRADALYAGEFSIVGAREYLYGNTGWENVGILKTGEYSLVLITNAAVADPDFYVPYYLTDTYLVYQPLWEACKTCFDADGNTVSPDSPRIASVTTDYCTSLDTSISYGPYRLTYFQQDKSITLERNDLWYGYADGEHHGQYQTDRISCQVIADQSTALLCFLNGELDSVSLTATDMEKYAASDAIRYTPETYTTKLTFNTDPEALSARGTEVLSNINFRRGFSLAIDRQKFAAQYTSAGVPGFGLLNPTYAYDPYGGLSYRDSPYAKNALLQLYGMTWGEDGDYPTLEDGYAAITGFDPALARQYMALAYDQVIRQGLYDGESNIVITLSVYQNDDIYTQMYYALNDALADACRGTGFAGKVSLEMTVDADYYATMESGLTDVIFSTWGGSAYDPYGILYNCYCDGGVAEYPNQMEYGFDAAVLTVTITLDGTEYTATLQDWARYCAGEEGITISALGKGLFPFRTLDADTRCAIYADLEWAYLTQGVVAPLYYRNSTTLVSQKGDFPTGEYLDLVGYGGIAFYTFRYCDSQWEQIKGSARY